MCELHVEHADGGRTVIASDPLWTACTGPIVYSDLLMGERYDARRALGPAHPVAVRPLDEVNATLADSLAEHRRLHAEDRPMQPEDLIA